VSADQYESCVRQSDFSPNKLLATEFCSPWWVAASHIRRRDGLGRMLVCRKHGAYPVGSMIRCPACGRSAPSDRDRIVCTDCHVESDLARFHQRLKGLCTDDRLEYRRLYWRRPVRVSEWINEGMQAPQSDVDDDLMMPAEEKNGELPVSEADLFDGSLEADQKWGNAPDYRDLLKQLRRRFLESYVTKKGKKRKRIKRRGAGCRKLLLPESEGALLKEIAYCQAHGVTRPSTRRVSNPFDRRERPLPMPGQPCRM